MSRTAVSLDPFILVSVSFCLGSLHGTHGLLVLLLATYMMGAFKLSKNTESRSSITHRAATVGSSEGEDRGS
jgi:hypothetical protein